MLLCAIRALFLISKVSTKQKERHQEQGEEMTDNLRVMEIESSRRRMDLNASLWFQMYTALRRLDFSFFMVSRSLPGKHICATDFLVEHKKQFLIQKWRTIMLGAFINNKKDKGMED